MKIKFYIIAFFLIIFFCTTPERSNPFDQESSTYGPPKVIAQKDTTVDINDTVFISAIASDNRGIDKLIWYGDFSDTCDTNFIIASFSDTGQYAIFVIAVDIDGVESNEDTVNINVTNGLPFIYKISDTLLSETVNLQINIKAYDTNKSGRIIKYLWDLGGDGWNDTTVDSTYTIKSTIGDTNNIICGVMDDDETVVTDTFIVIFNRVPISAEFAIDSSWEDFDIMSRLGKLNCIIEALDPDGAEDILTYNLLISEDSLSWSTAYHGDSTSFLIENLKAQKRYFYLLNVKDIFGDSLLIVGSFTTPTGPAIPDGMVFITSKDSSFLMGSDNGAYNEDPAHMINFTYDFWMDTTEVTQLTYNSVLNDSEFGFDNYTMPNWNETNGIGDSIPAYNVNWYDAAIYCNILSKINNLDTVYVYSSITGIPGNDCELENLEIDYTKLGYRLPTEAEWEYACRGGDTTTYFWGTTSSLIDDYIWYGSNSDYTIHGIAQKLPNSNNLFDISGNLWEWCNDNYGDYMSDTLTDPTGPLSGSYKVKRGGAWNLSSYFLRVAVRNSSAPTSGDIYIGFRAVLPE